MRRWVVAVGSAATVVLGGASSALINELHGGWGWFVAAGSAVLIAALLTGWLTVRSSLPTADSVGPVRGGDQLGPGAVKAGRNIRGAVTTHTTMIADGVATSPEVS